MQVFVTEQEIWTETENKSETYVRKQLNVVFFPWQGKMAFTFYKVQEASHYTMKTISSGLGRGVVACIFIFIVSLLRIVYAFACQHRD